ncbi:tail fiber protein [Galbibacter sp. EGI 63066]|uniref:tail fiber protein n=1 Tax=Galbibacter sp. EGI 63066 TaxID=2993559 RepID=UPI002248941E|nr:tail fiber protein [Galbibacter sp. EGI 63066]MCX2680629.1 tail fiber protein [Galbibacter sp. EGI 63066]
MIKKLLSVIFCIVSGYGFSQTNTFPNSGNVGVGTTSPQAKLHIFNGNNSYGAILANSSETAFSLYTKSLGREVYTEVFRLGLKYNTNENNGFISFYRGGSTSGGFLGFSTNGIERIRINGNGSVGIGTSTTSSHKLAVEGSIGAREVKVEASGWSDFVFENDYNLPTLEEVEQHIQEKGHLKDIPSAKEVEENGIYLGDMNAKLLQKIEELMLYTIEQQKLIETQSKKIETLEKLYTE